MEMTDQPNLLAEYVAKGSEEAFRELVTRYLSLVYSTAIRLANGDPCLAEDVTQTVFANLARLAATLSPGVMLGGWLHRRTWHVASATMRSERRRQHRERQAAEMNASPDSSDATFDQIAPVLDEVVNQLGEEDRAAITMRFLEGRDFRSVGEALGSNAEAARKRVDRALEKLRELLMRRGITAPGTTLAVVLAAHAVIAPPAGMAAIVSSAALASAAGSSGLTLTLLKLMATSTLKIAASTVVIAGLGTTLVLEHQALTKLSEKNRALQARLDGLARIAQDNQRLSNLLAQASVKSSLPTGEFSELLKLRSEVGLAHRLAEENPKLRTENTKLRMASKVVNAPPPKAPDDPAEAAFQKETLYRENDLKQWALRFLTYASKADAKSPDTWEQVADQLPAAQRDSFLSFATNNFEIVYHGQMFTSENGGKILFREKQARRSPNGEWVKTYGFADGSTETHSEPDGNFAAWESQH
jgi:RNA polymerase sigma factor (sigma-70 family)